MQPFPHKYATNTVGYYSGNIIAESRQSPQLYVSEPREFSGSDHQWSPEQMFVANVANCLVLTFRAITQASNFSWDEISCQSEGILDRVDGINQFTQINIQVFLTIASQAQEQRALRLLTKAENQCLIKNSISSSVNFINNIDYI